MNLPKLETPKYELVIPSTGKSVEYRPYTVKEEKMLLMSKSSNDSKAIIRSIRDIIKVCTFEEVDVNKLTMFDFEYIFLQLRSKSVGESAPIRIPCNSCDVYTDYDVEIDKLEVKGDTRPDMKVQLTESVGVVMRWPSFKMAEKYSDSKKSKAEEKVIEMVIDCIDSIYDSDNVYPADEQSRKELESFVDQLSTSKFMEMAKKLEASPKVTLSVDFKCMSCGHQNHRKIEGLENFF